MKIALCFSGLMRDVKETYPYFKKNLIDPNNIEDIFVHTWKAKDGDDLNSFKNSKYVYLEGNREFLLEKYKPKQFLEEDNILIKNSIHYRDNFFNNCITGTFAFQSQLYSINKVKEIKNQYIINNNVTYDYVVKVRFDLMILEPIIIKELDKNVFHASTFMSDLSKGWLGDIFHISNNYYMDKYMSLWNKWTTYIPKMQIHPEQLAFKYCKDEGIPLETPNKLYNYWDKKGNHILYRNYELLKKERPDLIIK